MLLALVLGIFIFTLLRGPIFVLISPLWRGQNYIALGLRNVGSIIRSKDALVLENNALREKLSSYNLLETSVNTLTSTQEEILALFNRTSGGKAIAAGVLVHPPETPYDIIIIDAGAGAGVVVGDQVSLPEGGALGKVFEVFDKQSKVLLYSSGGNETNAFLERHNIALTLKGAGGGTLKVDLPRDVTVEVGDRILLPGIPGELIGVVEEVGQEPTNRAKHVIISGVANVNSVRFVEVH